MAVIKKFVSYLRVRTDKQGRSGLGLEAQRAAVAAFLGDVKPLGEHVEVESGRDDARPQLQMALHRAKVTGAVLVIAKLDRLSRNVGFIARLQESGVRFVCADMPDATELTVNIFASLAQHERQVTSKRTKDAMAAAKALGRAFGNPNGARALLGLSNRPAVDAIKARADKHARDVLPIILDVMAVGISSLPGIANELNARGILTARKGQWHPTTVSNVLKRVQPHVAEAAGTPALADPAPQPARPRQRAD